MNIYKYDKYIQIEACSLQNKTTKEIVAVKNTTTM